MLILVINAGSSSLKYQLFDMPSEQPLCTGLIERIGLDNALIRHKRLNTTPTRVIERNVPAPDHAAAFQQMLTQLADPDTGVLRTPDDVVAVGHRVVHGGEAFSQATLITPAVKATIQDLFPLAPLHNPVNYQCIELAEQTFPTARQVAVFDTAFHQTLPDYAFRYALPEPLYRENRIRVYGFHGTSHKYVSQQALNWLERPQAKLISVHLGNGCSITAIQNGQSIDTSMGFSPLSGLVMGTRSGDIDPALVFYLLANGYTPEQVDSLLNKRSGMLGLTGSSDMRDVNRAVAEGDPAAALALELYAYRIRKYIGAYVAVLNGLDALVFTAGVGENDSAMRARICEPLLFLNVTIDTDKNQQSAGGLQEISPVDSPVRVLVVPTNEELEIASQCYELLTQNSALGIRR